MKKIIILIFVFTIYLVTLPSDIGLGDSGTLAAAAVGWGIPHPPGFPSYVLIAHWFSYLPWGTMAQKLAMVSVLASVTTVGLVMEMAGVIPALILAFSYGFWSQAVNVETYALTNLVIVGVSWMIWKMREMREIGGKKMGVMMGGILGIGVGLNPIVVGVIPSIIFNFKFLILNQTKKSKFQKILQIVIPATLIAIAIYSYLPMRAGQHPFLNWSDPSTAERFFKHVTGGGLSVVSSTAVNGFTGSFYWLINSFGRFIYVFFVETLGIGMILAVIGGYLMFKKERNKFWYWIILVFSNVILAGIYVSGNRDSWYVTGMIGGMMMIKYVPSVIPNLIRDRSMLKRVQHDKRWIPAFAGMTRGAGMICVALLLIVWGPRMWERARANYVGTYINDLYKDLPEKAILIGGGETFNSLTLYAHEAIKLRTDVTPVDMGIFYGQKWYRENGGNRGDWGGWGDKGVETAKFTDEGEFSRILEQFVEANSDRPVYISGFLLRRPIYGGSLRPAYLPRRQAGVPEKYKLEPWGIVYRLVPDVIPNSPVMLNSFQHRSDNEGLILNPASQRGEQVQDDKVGVQHDNIFYLESNYLKAVEDIQLDYGLALEMRGDFFGAARVAPKYFDQNRLNIKIKELNSVK